MNILFDGKLIIYGQFLLVLFIISACAVTEKPQETNRQEKSLLATESNQPVSVEKFPTPKDYSKAYSYRIGSPNQQIVSFIHDSGNDSLRVQEPESYLQALVSLIDSTKDEFEKVKMSYDAVSLLLDYDVEGFVNQKNDSQQWNDVLISGKSVCEGYANLFKKICDMLSIPCEKVQGYARGLYKASLEENTSPNHAWNIVKIKDDWYNVDCTWGSGALSQNGYNRRYNTDWLFVKSEVFIYTHFPINSDYQLLSIKKSVDEFKKLPRLDPIFFEKFSLESPLYSINDIDSSFSIELKQNLNSDFKIVFYDYEQGTEIKGNLISKQSAGGFSMTFHAPNPGIFFGVILYNVKDSLYGSCGYFLLNARKASSMIYPTLMRSSAKDVEIYSPLIALQPDSTYTFTVKVPNKKYVLLLCNGKRNRLNKMEAGIFSKQVKIPSDAEEIYMSASNEEFGEYEAIAKFKIKK